VAVLSASCTGNAAEPAVPTVPVMIKGHTVQAELARTPDEQQQGLMYRTSMPADRGMLFVFSQARPQAFWMKDTRLPLSIAFIDANQVITNLADMKPLDEFTIHRSAKPVLYALEVNQGWFAARGIGVGDKVEFSLPPMAEAPEATEAMR
jgi:uncharacterized membrane protein (UPF0127 family)